MQVNSKFCSICFYTGQPMTESRKKRAQAFAVSFALIVAALAYCEELYIKHLGYETHAWYESDKPSRH